MTGQRRFSVILLILFLIALTGSLPEKAIAGGFFLIDGVGLQHVLEIGMPAPAKAVKIADRTGWYAFEGLPLSFRKTENGRVAVIRCDNYCLTNRGIAVGSSRREVFVSYGTPKEERMFEGMSFLNYGGVGFLFDTKDYVRAIFILPAPQTQ